MAVADKWQTPLEEAVLKVLDKPDLSTEELGKIPGLLSMMDSGTEGHAVLMTKLENRLRRQEEEYQQALVNLDRSENVRSLENRIEEMKRFAGYKDTDEKVRQAGQRLEELKRKAKEEEEQRIRRQRKTKRIGIIAAICAVAVCVLLLAVTVIQKRNRINELKAQAQTMIDEGREREITDLLTQMITMDVNEREIYALSEAALESLAGREGIAQAFSFRDMLAADHKDIIDMSGFNSWVDSELKEGKLSTEDGWIAARDALTDDRMTDTDEVARAAYEAYVISVVEEIEKQDSNHALPAWCTEQEEWLNRIALSPDTAIRLTVALDHAGQDPGGCFPGGIVIQLPFGASISAFNNLITQEDPQLSGPDMSKMIPVSVEEMAEDDGTGIFEHTAYSEMEITKKISELQATDNHYIVRFLPEHFLSMPEDMRASSFGECTSVVAMAKTYLVTGYAYRTTQYSSGSKYSSLNNYLGTTSNYRGCFSAVVAVGVFDLREADHIYVYAVDSQKPIIQQDGWFNLHKNDFEWKLYTAENMLGQHDGQKLLTEYQEFIQYLPLYAAIIK